MNTAGNASQAFIRKCADIAPHIDAFLPRGLDVAELRKDIDLMDALRPIMVSVSQLAEKLRDTHALVASEAFAASREIYRCAKLAQGPAGLEDVVKELSRRFTRAAANLPEDTGEVQDPGEGQDPGQAPGAEASDTRPAQA